MQVGRGSPPPDFFKNKKEYNVWIIYRVSLAQLIRFLMVKLTQLCSNPKFDMSVATDFMNLKIKLTQSFGCAHSSKIYIHVFIGVSTYTYMSICVYTVFLKKSMFELSRPFYKIYLFIFSLPGLTTVKPPPLQLPETEFQCLKPESRSVRKTKVKSNDSNLSGVHGNSIYMDRDV
jgi:hypothetical protein